MITAQDLVAAKAALGGQLAAHRHAAGHSQATLAGLVFTSRSSIANVEVGRQVPTREFWQACDTVLDCDGRLIAGFYEWETLNRRYREQVAGAAEAERALRTSASGQSFSAGDGSHCRHAPLTCSEIDDREWVTARGQGASGAATWADIPMDRFRPDGWLDNLADADGTAPWHVVRPRSAPSPHLANLAAALVDYQAPNVEGPIPDAAALGTAVGIAKRHYQACEYTKALATLPDLITVLRAAVEQADGDRRQRIQVLLADAYQVVGSLCVKAGDAAMAVLAADRSMAAARSSSDPLALGSSARIITHALISGGHHQQATSTAKAMTNQMQSLPATPPAVSVHGALLLRGAVAAAYDGDRHTALGLLDDAHELAARLGRDDNQRWTAFGPTNVLLHRVSIAVRLGDAGQAIDHARRVRLDRVMLAERRATLFIDVAHALTQWGRYESAYRALLAAEHTAAQELSTSRAVRHLVGELAHRAPRTLRAEVHQLADRIGVTHG